MSEQKQNDQSGDEKSSKITFSLPQLLGSALAAATVAYVGSSLGTAGTVIGAALASVVGAVAGTLYTAGLDRTSRHLTTVVHRGWERVKGEDPSVDIEAGEGIDLLIEEHDPGTMAPVPDGPVGSRRPRTWWVLTLRVGVAALAIFALAFVAITAFELTIGRALDGENGTTVGQVVRPRPQPDATPDPTVTPEPSASPSATPAPSPSATPEPTPSASLPPTTPPAQTGEPSGEPSSSQTSAVPSPAAPAVPESQAPTQSAG